jgi:hypothetical protein
LHGLLDGGGGVGHGNLARDDQSERGELLAQPLLVRVEDSAQHKFRARIDDFDIQSGHNLPEPDPPASPRKP